MMASRFIPSLQFTGVEHKVDLLRLRLHKSAASIGETLSITPPPLALISLSLHLTALECWQIMDLLHDGALNTAQSHSFASSSCVAASTCSEMTSNNVLVAAADDLEVFVTLSSSLYGSSPAQEIMYMSLHAQQITDEEAGIAARKTSGE